MAQDAPKSQSVSQLKTASELANKRQELDRLRTADTREWALNRAFYRNDQWVIWNRMQGQVESLPVSDGDKPRWKVRLVSNQVTPGVEHYVAQLTKTRPIIRALPDSGSFSDRKAAEVGESLFEWWWRDLDLNAKLQTSLTDSQLSQGYWEIEWDEQAGKTIKFLVGPDQKPVTNPELADAYRDALEKRAEEAGVDPAQLLAQVEQTVSVGDIRVRAVPGEKVWLDPSASTFEDAQWAIVKWAYDPDEVWSRWGERLEPNTTPSGGSDTPLAYRSMKDNRPQTTVDVYCLHHRPTPALPKGRVVYWVEGPMKILSDGPWNKPFNELPLVKFPGIERPGESTDEARTTLVRPLQKELNRTLSQLVQHKDLAIKPQLLTPIGALRQKLTDEPGAAFEYQPVQGLKPEWRDIPQLPQYAFNILADIQNRIDKLYNRMPTQRDQLPARSDSGQQVEILHEAIADQMAPEIRRLEDALARAGLLMALLAKTYYIEPRTMKIAGSGGAVKAKKFYRADLEGGFSFHPVMDTGLPRSRAGKVQTIKELLEMQLINPRVAVKHLPLADVKGLQDKMERDEDHAYREHEKLINGEPINLPAAQQAVQQAQQGVNPQTGQPFASPEEAQQFVMQAALSPLEFEDWETHLEVHSDFMKSVEFERLPPEAQQAFVQHYGLTRQAMMDAQTQQAAMDPKALPNLGVTAKATVSAKVMAEMLKRHGINVTEQDVAELPLETAVYDSADKPNVQELGNAHADAQAMVDEQTRQDEAQQMSEAKSAHDAAIADEKARLDEAQQRQQMAHAEERHQQEQRRAEESHRTQQETTKQMASAKAAAAKKPAAGSKKKAKKRGR